LAVALFPGAHFDSAKVFAERLAHQRGAIAPALARRAVGGLQELPVEHNLNGYHMSNLLHSILHIESEAGFYPSSLNSFILQGNREMKMLAHNKQPAHGTIRASTFRLSLHALLLAGICAYLFFFGLGSLGLMGADEPRYAQIAREMLVRHDWVTPVLHGVPWLEKPVLYYWEAMLAYRLFGVSDWAARLPAAADTSLLVLAVYAFLRRRPRTCAENRTESAGNDAGATALDAGLVLASMAFVTGFARAASTDAPLAASLGLAMLAWLLWAREGRRPWLLAFYVLLGLGTLAKGPVAPLLAGVTIAAFAALRRQAAVLWRTLWWPAILLYCAVTLPWYVLVQRSTGNFFRVFLWSHNLQRFSTPVFRHTQPFWYYLPVMALALAPWTVLAIAALVDGIRRSRRTGAPSVGAETDGQPGRAGRIDFSPADLNLFLVLWGVIPVLFFSLSGSKLPGYILPALPPFAILLALWLERKREQGQELRRPWLLGHALAAGATFTAVLLSPNLVLRLHPPGAAVHLAVAGGLVMFCAVWFTVRALGLSSLHFVTLLPVILGMAFLLRVAAPALDPQLSVRAVAQDVSRLEPGQAPVATSGLNRDVAYGLGFYLDRPVASYENGEVPAGAHLLVTSSNPGSALAPVANRRIVQLGKSSQRAVTYYWIGSH